MPIITDSSVYIKDVKKMFFAIAINNRFNRLLTTLKYIYLLLVKEKGQCSNIEKEKCFRESIGETKKQLFQGIGWRERNANVSKRRLMKENGKSFKESVGERKRQMFQSFGW